MAKLDNTNIYYSQLIGEDNNGEWKIELGTKQSENTTSIRRQMRISSEDDDQELFINFTRDELMQFRDMINERIENF